MQYGLGQLNGWSANPIIGPICGRGHASSVTKWSYNINVRQTSRHSYKELNTKAIDREIKFPKRHNASNINIGPIDNGRPRVKNMSQQLSHDNGN